MRLLLDQEERSVDMPSGEAQPDTLESSHPVCDLDSKGQSEAFQRKRKQLLNTDTESEQPSVLKLLLAELQTLFSAVLQDTSPAAWRYLHAVLGLLPPYRELLVGHLDLLPFLEQLYCWAPWVKSQLQLDLLEAIHRAFPPDNSLLKRAAHVDCHAQKRIHQGPPCPACPFVQARWSGQQAQEELATWLRPLTLPELQHCLGIVGAEVALEEAWWRDGLSLLPLALATDIPVQYETCVTDTVEQEPVGRETKSQVDYEVPKEKAFLKGSTSFLGSQMMTILKTEKYLKEIHFLYLNVAPSRYFRPYDLMVVPASKVNPEHYIFSPFGILHVHPVEGSEMMTLGTWHRHSVLWQQLQFIPFFKHCLLRKALACWKKNVRLQGLCRLQTFLGKQLLLAVPHFGAGLLHINRILQELRSVAWLPQEPDRCYELLDLRKALARQNHRALRLLHRCRNLCTSILHIVHEDTYHMQQGLQERVQGCNRIRAGQGSIYLQRVQCKQLVQKLKQADTWLLQLGRFARLVDYMICQSLVSILENEITSFVANILQAPRQIPFLSSQLVFDDCGQLSQVPCIENMIQVLTDGLQSIKASALKVMQSEDLKTSLLNYEEDEDEDPNTEFLIPKLQSLPSDAVRMFCGPNVGLVWPWKSHTITGMLEVRGHRLRGQYLPTNYNQLQQDLDDNLRIQQALAIQHALMEGMLLEVQEFCREHSWIADIFEFLRSWGPQKLEDMRGAPIKKYRKLVSCLNVWQAQVSNMPLELLTKGKLLLLSCHDVQAELESKLDITRKEILEQVQNECCSRSQQLMTELTDFTRVFQTITSDIHAIARCSQKLNEASEQYMQLEERMEYIRSLLELIRNHFNIINAENEALDIALLDMWESFQFDRSQASEFLLSKQHSIVPKLQQLMAAALAELEGMLEKALSGPFMDPTQDQRSTEAQLISLERQFQNTVSHLSELHHAYATFTADESPVTLPLCGTRPIVLQQRIWHLYRIISEEISEWKCLAFSKFSLSMAQEKTDGWLTEAARMSTTLGIHSPVLQRCMRMLEEFRSYLPLLSKLSSFQLQNLNYQSLLKVLGLSSLHNMELLTLGQLLACPLMEFADRINQVWQCEQERIHAQESLQQLQKYWEARQLRLLNFILRVPYEPPASERSKKQGFRSPQWEVVGKDSCTFILSDYSSLQDSIQESLQTLFKILAIQRSGDLHKIALEWVTIMHSLGALLEIWMDFQQKWVFLNKVLYEMKIQFPSADLNTRFNVMDDQYRTLMRISVADPMVLSLVVPSAKRSPHFCGQQLQQLLQAGSMELESIIMALESVLYDVCAYFPRLFFLSDSELVALLATPLEPCEVQLWVRRCFPHVHSVSFVSCTIDEKSLDEREPSLSRQTQVKTLAVLGAGGEEVTLQEPLFLHSDLPKWLASLEKSLQLVLIYALQGCVAASLGGSPLFGETFKKLPQQSQLSLQLSVHRWLDSVLVFPWQCIVVAEEVVWRAEMEESLLEWGTLSMMSQHIRKLEVLVQFIRAQRSSLSGQPPPTARLASLLSALLVMAVTHRDIAQLLEKHQVSNLTDFHWARQLKYNLGSPHLIPKSPLQNLKMSISTETSRSPAACWIDVLGRSFTYNYEYLGPRLGPLPSLLPEWPMLALLLALEEVACGTLLGPDSTGKVGLVSNLAWALGRHLVIMPCLPQMEARCLSNYLNGALQGGAWLLLEAVHRLPPGLLSALGQHLAELHHLYAPLYREASESTSTVDLMNPQPLGSGFFEKHLVSVRLGYGCLLTLRALTPAVPANLHLLLRPVALAQPDLQRVAELALLGAGVRDASRLAMRLSKFFSLERELVSGPLPCRLSLLKQILESTISALNENHEELKSRHSHLAAMEEAVLLRALLHSPLFSTLDGLRLHSLRELLCGIFPSASQVLAEPVTPKLVKLLVVEELRQVGLHPSPDILVSLEQLSQALSQASGILLLGPAGSGKTTCWHSLFKIHNRLAAMENASIQGYQPVEITHLYPSVLSSQEFLGWLEGPCWHHGVFPRLFHADLQYNSMSPKEQIEESVGIQHWIVCDGAPGASWLDSITCLLSDAPKLSLPDGQQIARPPGTFLLMEMADATGMCPTVVGRCALVWCGGEQTWQCMLNVLMAALPHEYHLQLATVTELNRLAEVVVPAAIRFLTHKGALLQVHGQQAVCPGVAELTSLARILHSLLDPHLLLDERKKTHGSVVTEEDVSYSDPVAQSLRLSKSSSLNYAQVDSNSVLNKHREHLLAISSFIFALIWSFGAHLPSRFWPLFDTFLRNSISCLSNYPTLPRSALVFDLQVNPEDGTLVPFTGQYLNSRVRGTLGTFHPSIQSERLLYVVDLLLSRGQPVLLAGEAASGKSAFVQVLVEPNHPYIHSHIQPTFGSTHLRLLLSRGVQGQTQASLYLGRHSDCKGFLFLLEDLHLAASDPEKSCQPVLEALRQAMDGTVYAPSSLELQTLQPIVNFLATATVPGFCERPLCPRLFRLFTVLTLGSMTQATLLSRHVPSIQAWLERFPSVERENVLARALVRASIEAWEAVCNCFVPSPLRPHYRFSQHSVSHLLGSLQLVTPRVGSRGFVDSSSHQEHLRRVSGLRGTRLTVMMAMRSMVRLWLHEAQRTFCDRLDSPKERSCCAELLLQVAQNVFCCGPGPLLLGKEQEEEVEERVPEVESEGELAQWEDLSDSHSDTDEEEGLYPYGLQATTDTHASDPCLEASIRPVSREMSESLSPEIEQEESLKASGCECQLKKSKSWWQKPPQVDLFSPLLLPMLLLRPQEKPSDLVFSQELTLGLYFESPSLYVERQWESLQEQLATSAAQLNLSPHLARCHSMVQHVTHLARVLARPQQHGLLLSRALGTGRRTAITLACSICEARLFYLPSGPEEAILQCLQDASWHAGMLNQLVALLVPQNVDLTTLYHLVALANTGSFPDQYTEADLNNIEEHFPREKLCVKHNIKRDMILQRFYQQVCGQLHMFFLIGDDQVHEQMPATLFQRLLQLAIASIDRYEPWDQASLVRVAQFHLQGVQSLPLDDGYLKYPDLQASIPSVAKVMALIHLSAGYYHEHLCPALPLVTPKTFLDFLDTFLLLQKQMALQMKNKAQRIHNALENLRMLIEHHSTHANRVFNLERQLKVSRKSLGKFQQQLDQSRLQHLRQLADCHHQENLIENLSKQRDALKAQHEAFLDQMSKAFLGPLSQLQVADFEEIRSYRAPPEPVIRVTNALCDLFHRETGWASAKQLLSTEDFYQELVFFPKEKMTDMELIKLNQALKAPSMSDEALRAVSAPTANLAVWLWAVLRYGLAHRRGLPTGLLLRQVEATLAREQARLGRYQFQAQEILENTLALAKKLEDAQCSHVQVIDTLNQAQSGHYYKWPIKTALITPMNTWTTQLQKLRGHCLTLFGDALLCSAAIIYLGPFPPPRRQELLAKWLALCRGFQEPLGPDDVAQALKEKKSFSFPLKNPLLSTRFPFNILSLLSCESEQHQWDRDLKPQAKSARLAALILRSSSHYYSCRWPLLLDPSNQALLWLNPLPLEGDICSVPAHTKDRGKEVTKNQNLEKDDEDMSEDDDDDEETPKDTEKTKEQKAEEGENEEETREQEQEEKEEEEGKEEETEAESQESKPASETQSLPHLCLTVLSGTDPQLGPQLQEAAASGLPVLLTNMELGLGCQELQWLLRREQLSPPQVQPGFCLYLSTTLPLHVLEKGYELLKGLNVLDLGLNMEMLEEQMLHEILCRERPELEARWQDLKMSILDTYKATEAAEEQLLMTLLIQNPKHRKPARFLRDMVRTQAEICQLHANCEDLEEQKLQEAELWAPYRQVVWHGMAIVKALSPLQGLLPFFRMSSENWLEVTKQALDSMKPHDTQHGEDLTSHLLQLRIRLTHYLMGSTMAALGLHHVPLVGALGSLALLQMRMKAPKLERLALWPGLGASPSTVHRKPDPSVARPAWIGPKAWYECGLLELLPPFAGLRVSLAGHSNVWQEYLSLSSTVLGPAPGPGLEPLSLFQKLILWRVLRPECLAGALADLTTSTLGRPLDERLGAPTMPFECSQVTQPVLILLPPSGNPTATLHPLTVIRNLAATYEQEQKHLQVISLGSEAWDPVSTVVSTLYQAMFEGYWLVLDNCHLLPHWPKELLQPLLELLDRANASDMELEVHNSAHTQPESGDVITVHRDFRLWLIVSAEASASVPAVLSQHCMPVFWDRSLELGHVLINSVELAQQGLYMQPPTRPLPLLLLHGLLLHRQLYGMRLQTHRGRWSQATLNHALETQKQLWASLSNPGTAMQELAASVFYGGCLEDAKDREALISLTEACLSSASQSCVQSRTPQYLLATLMPSPELEELDAIAECKAQIHQLTTPSEPRFCGLSEGPQAWLLRRRSRALLSTLQQSSPTWVPAVGRGARRAEKRLLQRLVLAKRRLESLKAVLTDSIPGNQSVALWKVLGPDAQQPLEGFLEAEVLELSQLVDTLQRDLDCLLGLLKGETPCSSRRCAAVAHALWAGRLPPPWRPHATAGPQPPWQWLRQLSRRGQLLVRYLGVCEDADTRVPERVFHLSAFSHPSRLLLALRWEAALRHCVPSLNSSGSLINLPQKHQELNNNPLCLQVVNGPNPEVPEAGLLLIGLQLVHAQWDPLDGVLLDSSSSQPSPLPPVSVSAQAPDTNSLPVPPGMDVYSCPVYMAGPFGTTKLHSRNILMHLPLPTKLSPAICIQRRVHACSPPLPELATKIKS